ncbi:MAG TPA: hypothetical protein VHB72_04725 [Candidatus Saccharimonadales bacterium]|nr:hypothetical protein [Candidatus Saccharimonadales bacterium]
MLSYNEEQLRALEIRHLFWPRTYIFFIEAIIAVVLLLLFNVSTLNDQVLNANTGVDASPFSLWGNVFDKTLGNTQHAAAEHILLFGLWALVGALLYVLIFRFLQFFLKAQGSVRQGASLIQAEHSQGAMRYLGSLHNFFLKLIVIIIGTMAILTGALVCFGIASQELSKGLDQPLPNNLLSFLISFLGALLAVRLIIIGGSLISPRFRAWYNS